MSHLVGHRFSLQYGNEILQYLLPPLQVTASPASASRLFTRTVFAPCLEMVQTNLNDKNKWEVREASILALGAVAVGCFDVGNDGIVLPTCLICAFLLGGL